MNIHALDTLDLIGTFVFAISGTLAASNQRFDVFGALVIAFVTAVGGGTVRDLLIGSHPIAWMQDLRYLYTIIAAVICSYFFKRYILKLRKTLFLFDTIGIGLFTILGVQKTLDMGLSPVIAVMMGTVSAVFGGVIRDTFCNLVPLIFRKEVYATACIVGAVLFLFLSRYLSQDICILITVTAIILLRIVAVRQKWSLPVIK